MEVFSQLHQPPTLKQQIMTVAWLSFLIAGVATGVFFTVVDPYALSACVSLPEDQPHRCL